jgi:hypothetical protein
MVSVRPCHTKVEPTAIPFDHEAFCARLGPFLNIDRKVDPNELNLMHVTIEHYLQSGDIQADRELFDMHVTRLPAQRFLAETCIRFCGFSDFEIPLSESDSSIDASINPFKGLHGGLGLPQDTANPWIARMHARLVQCVGFEYASINWPEHVRRAEYSDQEFEEHVVPILDWFLDPQDPRYRSWQEAHGYFCSDPDCACERWRSPLYFARRFRLGLLRQCLRLRDAVDGDASLPTEARPSDNMDNTVQVLTEEVTEGTELREDARGPSTCRKRVDCFGCKRRVSIQGGVVVKAGGAGRTHRDIRCPDCRTGKMSDQISVRNYEPTTNPIIMRNAYREPMR